MDPLDPSGALRADGLTATFEQHEHGQRGQQPQRQQQQHSQLHHDQSSTSTSTYFDAPQTASSHRFGHVQSSTWPMLNQAAFIMAPQQVSQPQSQPHSHSRSSMDSDSSDEVFNPSTAMNQRALTIATSNSSLQPDLGLAYTQALLATTTGTDTWNSFNLPTAPSQQVIYPNNFIDNAFASPYGAQLQNSPIDFIAAAAHGQQLNSGLPLDPSTQWPITTSVDQPLPASMPFAMNHLGGMNGFATNFTAYQMPQASNQSPSSIASHSPGEQWQEYAASSSNRSENDWTLVNYSTSQRSLEFADIPISTVVSPQALHIRTDSSASDNSDIPLSAQSCGSGFEDMFPMTSPEPELDGRSSCAHSPHTHHSHPIPIHPPGINTNISRQRPAASSSASSPSSGSGAGSPSAARRKKSPTGVSGKVIDKKKNAAAKDKSQTERRVGRRRGPLRPDQRQQAHEIRKVGACLRCKYLKKTCDKGDPCTGCKPSHARLWQVPCTRIDIKDIGYFFKDWTADYARHITMGFSIANIKGFSESERVLNISHGYGFDFQLMAREVYVRDDKCFGLDWVETLHPEPTAYEVQTNKLSAGMGGVSNLVLSEYLDRYVDYGFEPFVDQYFEGTPFLTEILKTAYRFWLKTQLPVVRKGLKLVVAYALTLHITMVNGMSEEEMRLGRIDDETSRWHGATVAPVMINFEIKKALADMWRELMNDILQELSQLYSSVYSGEKLKHWPTIFMLASLLLAVWEMMQFDCSYRVPDEAAVAKFCNDMESTPVGVIVGLFQAISTKLPTFAEWDTSKHSQMLNNNVAVCEAMTEVQGHVTKYEQYLRSRSDAKFDRGDFDSLSNKFLSKLVIRAGAS